MPAAVSTCGANTTAGFSRAIAAVTSAIGAGAQGASRLSLVRRALSTVWLFGICPISKICVQRKLNQPLRITMTCCPVANCRATDSMPKVPLPGTRATEWAW